MFYLLLKPVHVALAVLSVSGFVYRWLRSMRAPVPVPGRWRRAAPHILDTVLLITGVLLAASTAQYPWTSPWLAAKLAGLPAYILLGMAAMSARSAGWRTAAFAAALAMFAWIVSVARMKTALGLMQPL